MKILKKYAFVSVPARLFHDKLDGENVMIDVNCNIVSIHFYHNFVTVHSI